MTGRQAKDGVIRGVRHTHLGVGPAFRASKPGSDRSWSKEWPDSAPRPHSVSSTPTADAASQTARQGISCFCIPDLNASGACLSPVRPNGARRVLRGRRRSNAPPLRDWKPVFYLLEAHGFDVWLVNARDVKHLPGRPKTDVLDAVWLCKVAERQMIRPSFVPPPGDPPATGFDQAIRGPHRHLRDLRAKHDGRAHRRGT
jgi:hypothetical protein